MPEGHVKCLTHEDVGKYTVILALPINRHYRSNLLYAIKIFRLSAIHLLYWLKTLLLCRPYKKHR